MLSPRRAASAAVLLAGLLMLAASGGVLAANPSSVTVSPGGPSQGWTGSVAGQGDVANGFGLLAPSPLPSCQQPGCDDETVNLTASNAAPGSLTLSVTLNYAENGNTATNDFFILDQNRNVLASNGNAYGNSLTITATNLSPGTYIAEVDADGTVADNNNAVPSPYTASAKAGRISVPVLPNALGFAPATVVSPTFLGAEPQVAMERGVSGAPAGAINRNRLFVDWPLGSGVNIGQLSRSTDGGSSFRLLYDPACAFRSRPMCTTGGGGDTVNRVNQFDGSVYFGDQEALANEAFAASHDHGDTFPVTSSDPAGSYGTDVDRQWIATVDAPPATYTLTGGLGDIRGFYAFHQPGADATIEAVDQNDHLIPPPGPQVPLVGQSGPLRVDSVHGYVYLPYRDFQGVVFHVASAPIASWNNPMAWHSTVVNPNAKPNSFPWISLDTAGNLYATWTNGDGPTWYSYSLWNDPANNPATGGVPGTKWSTAVKVSLPSLGSTYFPAVVAGDPGRVAIAYMGTPDFSGPPPNAPATARWYTFVAESTNGLAASPSWQTGAVSHHPDHTGGICTSGTTCAAMPGPGGDRSLADMIYVDVDSSGRPGVVFMNNDNQEARDTGSMGQLGNPFVKFAKMTSGPSLFAGHAAISLANAHGSVSAPAGNATWPDTASGVNQPALDELKTALYPDGQGNIVGRIDLADASTSAAASALNALNAQPQGSLPFARLQYVLRWEMPGTTKPDGTDDQVGYLAMDVDSSGSRTFYGGVLNGNAALLNPLEATAKRASGYPATAIHVEGKVVGNSVYLIGTSNDLQTGPKQPVYSVTGFAMAGPAASTETLASPMRVVDATPPFDLMGSFQANPLAVRTTPFTAATRSLRAGSLLGGAFAGLGLVLLGIGGAAARSTLLRRR